MPSDVGTPEHVQTPPPERPSGRDWWARHLWEIQPVRDGLVIAAVFGLVYLGYLLSVVTVPLLVAMALAYLFEPLVRWLTTGGRGRVFSREGAALLIIILAAVAIVVPLVFGLGYGVYQGVTFAQEQATNVQVLIKSLDRPDDQELKAQLPGPRWLWLHDKLMQYKREFEEAQRKQEGERAKDQTAMTPPPSPPAPGTGIAAPPAEAKPDPLVFDASDTTGVMIYKAVRRVGRWVQSNATALSREALATGASAVGFLLELLGSIGFFLFGAFLTAFFFFFICVGYGRFLSFWESLIPERRRLGVIHLLQKMDAVIAGFIRGRLTICAIMTVYYTLALLLVGAPTPLILGPVFGFLHLIPYAASLSVPITAVLMLLDPAGTGWQGNWWWALAGPVIVYLGGQLVDDYILTPTIQGKTTNMDTPTILFSSMAGGILGGFYGLLLAIPLGACIKILLKEVVWPRFRMWGEGRASDPLPFKGSVAPPPLSDGPPTTV